MAGKEGDIVFVTLLFIVGALLSTASIMISSQSKCDSSKLRKLNQGVLMAGTILATASVATGFCHAMCDCGSDSFGMDLYSGSSFILGVFMIVMGAMMLKEGSGCETVKVWCYVIIGLGAIMTVLPSSYFAYGLYVKSKSQVLASQLLAKTQREKAEAEAAAEAAETSRQYRRSQAAKDAASRAEAEFDASESAGDSSSSVSGAPSLALQPTMSSASLTSPLFRFG